ncbi:hypothetical protein COOONC_01849 [Cooperia oncophora]
MLLKQNPNGVFITESWCKPHMISDATLSGQGKYAVFRCDRDGDRQGGGVIVALRKDIPHRLYVSKNFSEYCQVIIMEVTISCHVVIIATIYRSPSCRFDAFWELITFLSDLILDCPSKIIIMGDLNFPLIDWTSLSHRGNLSSPSSTALIDLCVSFNLKQLVMEPTLGLNILDIVLTSDPEMVRCVEVMPPFSTSDHRSISVLLSQPISCQLLKYTLRPNFARGDFVSINRGLLEIDWVPLIAAGSPNDAYSLFVSICHSFISQYVPCSKAKTSPGYIPKKILRLRAKVNRIYANVDRYGFRIYAKYAQKLKRLITRLAITEEEKLAKQRNLRRFFRYCNSKLNVSDEIPELILDGNTTARSDWEKVVAFAEYFRAVYRESNTTITIYYNTENEELTAIKRSLKIRTKCKIMTYPCSLGVAEEGLLLKEG